MMGMGAAKYIFGIALCAYTAGYFLAFLVEFLVRRL